MSFPSCNRLLEQKQIQVNTRYHHLKLQEIKQSRNKEQKQKSSSFIVTSRKRFQQTERQRQIAKDNEILLQKLSTIIDKTPQVETSIQIQCKSQKIPPLPNKSPNRNQKSFYSAKQLRQQWKQHKQHLKMATRIHRTVSKSTKDTYHQPPSSNKIVFHQMIKLFGNLGLQKPNDIQLQQPQNLAQRIVLSRKTVIIEDIPYLIEFSSISKMIFIIAHNMSNVNGPVIRLKLSQKESKTIFEQNNYDYETIANKISISGSKLSIKDSIQQIPDQDSFINQKKFYSLNKTSNRSHKKNKIKLSEFNPSRQFRNKMSSLLQSSDKQDSTKIIKSTNCRVSKRYNTQSQEDKKFSMAVTMKKKQPQQSDSKSKEVKEKRKSSRISSKKQPIKLEFQENNQDQNQEQDKKTQLDMKKELQKLDQNNIEHEKVTKEQQVQQQPLLAEQQNFVDKQFDEKKVQNYFQQQQNLNLKRQSEQNLHEVQSLHQHQSQQQQQQEQKQQQEENQDNQIGYLNQSVKNLQHQEQNVNSTEIIFSPSDQILM